MNPLLLDFPEEFESERLLIRGPRAGDGSELNAAVCESLEELKPWMPWAQSAPSVEESEEVCRNARIKFLAREDLMLQLRLKKTARSSAAAGCTAWTGMCPNLKSATGCELHFADRAT